MNLARVGVTALLVLLCSTAHASDWPRFRGPNGSGVSADQQPTPTKWSKSENLKWKTLLPGPGVSSPIVIGKRIFVTSFSGYGADRSNPGEIEDLKRHLVCIDADTGKVLWDETVDAVLPEDPYTGMGIPSHGYASHSPVSDGERVYVFFGKTGALAFDMEGNQLWQKSVGTESDSHRWGSASSPILYKDLLIVTASAESQALVALNTETGEEVWRQEASGLDNIWGTPALVEVDDGRTEIVIGVPYEIWGFNPDNGKLRWYAEAMQSEQFQSSVVVHNGMVLAIEGRGGGSIGVRAGGKGNVTASHVAWTGRDSSRFGSPVAHDGRVYSVSNGVASCIDAKTGKKVFQARLEGGSSNSRGGPGTGRGGPRGGGRESGGRGGPGGGRGGFGGFGGGGSDYSSPVIADGKLYYVKGNGEAFVLKIGSKFEQLALNKVTDDNETFGATPAISDGRLFIRSNKHIYCIAEE